MQHSKEESTSRKPKKRKKKKSKGLGDTVAKVTKATGIEKAVKFIAGEDCGCDERKETLNKWFPYNVPECLNENEYNFLNKFFKNKPVTISVDTQKQLLTIHNRIYKQDLQLSRCAGCVKDLVKRLEKVFKAY